MLVHEQHHALEVAVNVHTVREGVVEHAGLVGHIPPLLAVYRHEAVGEHSLLFVRDNQWQLQP